MLSDNTRHTSRTNELLGYPADARLLLVNADDLGMCHAVNVAIMAALQNGIVTSCSVMVPCPWARHALAWLQSAPQMCVGVHLTSISEQPLYRWGPVICRTEVPTLVDETGNFYPESRIDEFLAQMNVDELEREYRAQIEHVLAAGVQPTHLDSHCGIHVRHADVFDMTYRLAREYGVALLVYAQPYIDLVHQRGYPTNNHPALDSYSLPTTDKAARYAKMLRALPVGLTEWAVHPGLGNAELQAVMPSWEVRQTDFDFLMSPEARAIVQEEGITLVDTTVLQAYWRKQPHA